MYPMLTMTNSNKRKLIAGTEMIGEANLSPEVTPPWRNYMGECCRGSWRCSVLSTSVVDLELSNANCNNGVAMEADSDLNMIFFHGFSEV